MFLSKNLKLVLEAKQAIIIQLKKQNWWKLVNYLNKKIKNQLIVLKHLNVLINIILNFNRKIWKCIF